MTALQIFPVWKKYDAEKGKWTKAPAVPKGVDWHTYEAKPGELERATNLGIVIPAGVVVLDLDTYKGVTTTDVDAALGVALDWELAELQETVTGGRHYAFSIKEGVTIRQGDNLLGVTGFDTRTTGKGWICTGEGYTDLTLIGIAATMSPAHLPALPVEAVEKLQHGALVKSNNAMADLEDVISARPLDDLGMDDMRAYLKRVPVNELETYQSWLNIGMACHHQCEGSKDGLRLWVEASKRSSQYNPDEIKAKWPTFGRRNGGQPITFAYVIKLAGGRKAIAQDRFDTLLERASNINEMADYEALKNEVREISLTVMGPDLRGMIAAELALNFGKNKGITRTDIKRALMPEKKKQVVNDNVKPPGWVADWVYVEIPCEFAHTELGYAIRREAFCAKYDRMADCVIAERSASSLALNEYGMPTVVDKMFWPGADVIFDYEGKAMLNAYRQQGIEPCDALDDDGQDVVDMFLSHLFMLVESDKERFMLLDWLAYVVQNPGQRVNWALLLQGAQGIGKTYFVNVLQMVLGSLVTNLDPQAIAGRFTSWAHGSLVVAVEEIRISGTNRFEVLDRMKPFITNPTVQIEEKGRDHRTVPNFTSYLLLTNHKDAIPLTAGDRRYGIIFSRIQSEEQLYSEMGGEEATGQYFTRLFDESNRRADALARWLLDYQITPAFDPKGRAPETAARQMMMDVSISPERSDLEDAISKYSCEVINERLIDVTWLNKQAVMEGDELPKTRAVSAILLEMGYEQIPSRRVKIDREYHYLWFAKSKISCSEAKQICHSYHKA